MKTQRLIATLATAFALSTLGTTAMATSDSSDYMGAELLALFKFPAIDANKDGMVAKTEFMAMAGKAWDMKAKEMKVEGDKTNEADFSKWMSSFLSRGGNKN